MFIKYQLSKNCRIWRCIRNNLPLSKTLLKMNEELEKIKKDIAKIRERNLRVEEDKACETSYFRILPITFITYIVAAFLLYFIGAENYFWGALVPAAGFFLSTQTLPFIKKWWLKGK